METERVERGTSTSRVFAVLAVALLAVLVAMPWWGDSGQMRLVAEMAYYVALAQLWNLLAGYAGLVSVGQQAYVGVGGYTLFYLTGALDVNVYVALLLAGPFAGLLSIPVSVAVFRLRSPISRSAPGSFPRSSRSSRASSRCSAAVRACR